MSHAELNENLSTRNSHSSEKAKNISRHELSGIHQELAVFNQTRFTPSTPSPRWQLDLAWEAEMKLLERKMLMIECEEVRSLAQSAPHNAKDFREWFEDLRHSGPGQNDSLFDWLEGSANRDEMTWFIRQEVVGEAGFEDLTALTQVKMPTRPKLEFARNYWDEMGRGNEKGMHGPMLTALAKELAIQPPTLEEAMPEAITLGNLMIAMAANRDFAFHSTGALGVIELTAPDRAMKVYRGLKRLGLSPEAQRYYLIHSSLDVKHSQDWNAEILIPLLTEAPELAPHIAEGALLRLNAGKKCYDRYRKVLWNSPEFN